MTKFIVERVTYTGTNPPCEEAVQEPGYMNKYWPRELENVYTLKIVNLNQLIKFADKYGKIIIVPTGLDDNKWEESGLPLLIIYDDWIE